MLILQVLLNGGVYFGHFLVLLMLLVLLVLLTFLPVRGCLPPNFVVFSGLAVYCPSSG